MQKTTIKQFVDLLLHGNVITYGDEYLCAFCNNLSTKGKRNKDEDWPPLCDFHMRPLMYLYHLLEGNYTMLETFATNHKSCDCCAKMLVDESADEALLTIPLTEGDHEQFTTILCRDCREVISESGGEYEPYINNISCDGCDAIFQVNETVNDYLIQDQKTMLTRNGFHYKTLCGECIKKIYGSGGPTLRRQRYQCDALYCKNAGLLEVDLILTPPICPCNEVIPMDDSTWQTYIEVHEVLNEHDKTKTRFQATLYNKIMPSTVAFGESEAEAISTLVDKIKNM